MTDIENLKNEEISKLSANTDKQFDLETLILEGENARIPIEIQYPVGEETVPVTAILKPLTSPEVQTAVAITKSVRGTTLPIEIVKMGLFTKDNEEFPKELVMKMPTGVIDEICKKLMVVSGVQPNEEESEEFINQIMGF